MRKVAVVAGATMLLANNEIYSLAWLVILTFAGLYCLLKNIEERRE